MTSFSILFIWWLVGCITVTILNLEPKQNPIDLLRPLVWPLILLDHYWPDITIQTITIPKECPLCKGKHIQPNLQDDDKLAWCACSKHLGIIARAFGDAPTCPHCNKNNRVSTCCTYKWDSWKCRRCSKEFKVNIKGE